MKRFCQFNTMLSAALLSVAAAVSSGAIIEPAYAFAGSDDVTLASEAMIERSETDAAGRELTVLKNPKDVVIVPGDRVVFTLKYANKGELPANGFRATNPMPGPVQFVAANEDWAEVSVDGGQTWGKLSDLTVQAKGADGASIVTRAAGPQDVTHVRWVFATAIAPGSQGSVSYRGVIK
jgi:uncharacterized repeat protein (TIGR01451 family)